MASALMRLLWYSSSHHDLPRPNHSIETIIIGALATPVAPPWKKPEEDGKRELKEIVWSLAASDHIYFFFSS